ncbi:MAG: carboxypeptidase-like regulatory domain-containing protein [Planctomycetota bacterium]
MQKLLIALLVLAAAAAGITLWSSLRSEDGEVATRDETAPTEAPRATRREAGPAEPEAVGAADLSGRCVDETGAPVAADVTLTFRAPPGAPETLVVPPPRRLRADATGRFSFAVEHYLGADLRAKAPGRIDGLREDLLFTGRATDLGDVVLAPGCHLDVRVRDEDDRPVVGAAVQVGPFRRRGRDRRDGGIFLAGIDEAAARTIATDIAGTARAEGLAPGAQQILIEAEGFLPWAARDVIVGPDTAPVEVRLSRGRTLRGVVRDERGGAVSGALIRLDPTGFAAEDALLLDRLSRRARSGADGRFELADLTPRAHRLFVSRPGFLAPRDRVLRPDENDLEIVLPDAGRFGARLRDAASGRELEPLSLELTEYLGRGRESEARILRGEEAASALRETPGPGLFLVEGLGASGLRVQARFAGHAEGYFETTAMQSGELRFVVIEVPPEVRVSGQVRRHGGGGADGAVVSARLLDYAGDAELAERELASGSLSLSDPANGVARLHPAQNLEATADAEGRFDLGGLTPGARYAISARHEEFGTSSPFEFTIGPDGLDSLELQLPPVGFIEGVVVDAEGRPRAGVEVGLRGGIADDAGDAISRMILSEQVARAFSDARGRFRFRAVEPGSYVVDLGFQLEDAEDAPSVSVTILPGRTAEIELRVP